MSAAYLSLPIYFHTEETKTTIDLGINELDADQFTLQSVTFNIDSIDYMCPINFHGEQALEIGVGGRMWKTPIQMENLIEIIDEIKHKESKSKFFSMN